MNRVLKGVMVGFLISLILTTVRFSAMAQLPFGFPPLWDYQRFSTGSVQIPEWWKRLRPEDILVDDFEYNDNPSNHRWIELEPIYPTYGYGHY